MGQECWWTVMSVKDVDDTMAVPQLLILGPPPSETDKWQSVIKEHSIKYWSYTNICWALHLNMVLHLNTKCFTMATTAIFSASVQTHHVLVISYATLNERLSLYTNIKEECIHKCNLVTICITSSIYSTISSSGSWPCYPWVYNTMSAWSWVAVLRRWPDCSLDGKFQWRWSVGSKALKLWAGQGTYYTTNSDPHVWL